MAPRTARPLLLTVIGLVTVSLFFWAPSSIGYGTLYYRDPYSSRAASLTARLREEEARYAATLKAREGLIKKHGPSKEEIESYPTTGSYTKAAEARNQHPLYKPFRPHNCRAYSSRIALSSEILI